MDYGKSFTFVFEDEKWIGKFLVGALISLVPIINFAAYGYMIQLLKNVRDGVEDPLPEWDDFAKFLVDGLKFMVGLLVYIIPVILISFVIMLLFLTPVSNEPDELFSVAIFLVSCLIMVLSMVPLLFYPALFIQYAKEDKISDMFKFSEMWDLFKADSANYLVVLLMIFFVLGFIASFGILICFVGVFLTAWWSQLIAAHIMGQLAKPKEKPAVV